MSQTQRISTSNVAALPIKDALRMVRYTMKRSRNYLARPPVPLPAPISNLANSVLSEVDHIANDVNEVAAEIAHRYLDLPDAEPFHAPSLSDVEHYEKPEIVFAQGAYRGLTHALDYMGAQNGLVSEVRAADAYKAAVQSLEPDSGHDEVAAALMDEMLRREVVCAVTPGCPDDADGLTMAELPAVAVYALVLWIVAERDRKDQDEEALLLTCCDLARALRSDVLARDGDRGRLHALIVEYADRI